MKMVAIGTVHGRKLIKKADPKDHNSKAKYADLIAKPGEEFESDDFGISKEEAVGLLVAKAAKRKMREVADEGDTFRDPLEKFTGADLLALATARGLTIKDGATKEEIIAELNKVQA